MLGFAAILYAIETEKAQDHNAILSKTSYFVSSVFTFNLPVSWSWTIILSPTAEEGV